MPGLGLGGGEAAGGVDGGRSRRVPGTPRGRCARRRRRGGTARGRRRRPPRRPCRRARYWCARRPKRRPATAAGQQLRQGPPRREDRVQRWRSRRRCGPAARPNRGSVRQRQHAGDRHAPRGGLVADDAAERRRDAARAAGIGAERAIGHAVRHRRPRRRMRSRRGCAAAVAVAGPRGSAACRNAG